MKFELKKAARPALLLAGILTVGGAIATQAPAWADKAVSQALIEPELEIGLKKHFERRFFNLIDASDEQKTKLDGLITKQIESTRPLRAQIREHLMDLSDMMADGSTSDDAIRKKVEEIRAVRSEIQDKRLNTILEARSVLTDEQKKVVSARMKGLLTGNPRLGLRGMRSQFSL